MTRRNARTARLLGLWSAVWLAVFLGAGLVWLGDLSRQWPVLAVPVLWALLALRPRRGERDRVQAPARDRDRARGWEVVPAPGRTDTVERSAVRDPRHPGGGA